jgi:hypothetical protein
MLVWFEQHDDIREAIRRETNIKGWLRAWKLALIEKTNPDWRDLYDDILPHPLPGTPKLITPPPLSFRPESRNPDEPSAGAS